MADMQIVNDGNVLASRTVNNARLAHYAARFLRLRGQAVPGTAPAQAQALLDEMLQAVKELVDAAEVRERRLAEERAAMRDNQALGWE